MKNKYESYEKALNIIDLEYLSDRRNQLCKDFAQKAAKNGSIEFQLNIKSHTMNNRIQNIYEESHCNTQRLLKSAIPQMQRLLNIQE